MRQAVLVIILLVAIASTVTAGSSCTFNESGVYVCDQAPECAFDPNGDGVVDPADLFYLINYVYSAGPPPIRCGDANGDGAVNAADIDYLIAYIYTGGPDPVGCCNQATAAHRHAAALGSDCYYDENGVLVCPNPPICGQWIRLPPSYTDGCCTGGYYIDACTGEIVGFWFACC